MAFTIRDGILLKYTPEDGETTAVIPEGVTVIGKDAFLECADLTSVSIPKGVTEIGNHAFFACPLTSVEIPEGVTRIGAGAFCKCGNLTHVTIPDGVQRIEGMAFGRSAITSAVIPDSVTFIEERCFYGCENLMNAVLPAGITNIGGGTFYGCKNLTSVSIPDGVKQIGTKDEICGSGAFVGCRSLVSVHIPDGVELIGSETFSGCENLTGLDIPDSVAWIGDHAFDGCRSIRLFGITFSPKVFREKDYTNARKMLETKDFSIKLDTKMKYAAAVGFWMKTGDEAAEAFLKKSISRIMPFLMDHDNIDVIRKMLDSEKFITKKNIDKFIGFAIVHTQNGGSPEIQTMLMHHKSETVGYRDPSAQFKL